MQRNTPPVGDHAAERLFQHWLEGFATAMEAHEPAALMAHFGPDSHWKDLLAFTWEHRTFSGPHDIAAAFAATRRHARPHALRRAADRIAPRLRRRSGRAVLEGFFDFDTEHGRGSAFVRLLVDTDGVDEPRIWLLLTTLQALRGFEDRIGQRRPTGEEFARNELGRSWRAHRAEHSRFGDRDPEVLIIGGGQSGLSLAARLGQMGTDALVIEKHARIGDVWRQRYESLTLHNETMANHLPYLPFPETWPLWLAKDQLADWLEAYAGFLDLNVWTGTTLRDARYEDGAWTIHLRRADGTERRMRCPHLVLATGVSGTIPHVPALPGLDAFGGEVTHSRDFHDGARYRGKRVVVVGTGNSGHDLAQDLVVKGAEKVWMLQRGPTCVASLEPSAAMVYKIYAEGLPTEDVDLMAVAVPYPLMEDAYRWITRRSAELDKDLLEGLNRAGFRTYFGSDGTGFQMMFLRGEGGYYIDVGCSRLIADGTIGVIQADASAGWERHGLRMQDGSLVECDAVLLATGFRNMQETVRQILGDAVADRLGPVWGFDEHMQMRNMWRRTGQPGLWLAGGSLLDCRVFSRFLALEIKAALEGILPETPPLAALETA